jgi:malate dehydrogenase (oxaloacetate-decarboxylating)(NADP+)
MESGSARRPLEDLEAYRESLESIQGKTFVFMRSVMHRARKEKKRIVFPQGEHPKILKACRIILDQKIAEPILLGEEGKIRRQMEALELELPGVPVIDVLQDGRYPDYVQRLYDMRQRKGVSLLDARALMSNPNYFGTMMVHTEEADGMISGVDQRYQETLRPALQIARTEEGVRRVAGLFVMIFKNRTLFFADTTVNINPSSEELAEIARLSARLARQFNIKPRIAMLSYSNFGSTRDENVDKVRKAITIVEKTDPDLMIEGEIMADTAVEPELAAAQFPFSRIQGDANILIFPDLTSGNIAYKLLQQLGGAEVVGPILMGLSKPIHVLQAGCSVNEIVHMTAVAVVDAQKRNPF